MAPTDGGGGFRMERWQTWATVVSAFAALVAVLVTLNVVKPFGDDGGEAVEARTVPGVGGTAGAVATTAPATVPGSPACYGEFFGSVPRERVRSLEEGAFDVSLLRRGDPVTDPAGLTFTSGGRPIGALRFRFFPENELFLIEAVIDDTCRAVTDFGNESRPDFPKDRLLSNNDLRMRFTSGSYRVHFDYDTGLFRLNFSRA